jgi:hypothetical protein
MKQTNEELFIKGFIGFLIALIIGLIATFSIKAVEKKKECDKIENKIYYDTFVTIEERTDERGAIVSIVYDKDTKVMYYYTHLYHNQNYTDGLTPIYNPDGTIQVYKE